jgi:hypothetical protein
MRFEELYLFLEKYLVDKYDISVTCRNKRAWEISQFRITKVYFRWRTRIQLI